MTAKTSHKFKNGGRRPAPRTARSRSLGRSWEDVNLPTELLDHIAIVVNAHNPDALRRKTFPAYPIDAALLVAAVWFEDHKEKINYDGPTQPRQTKQMELVAEIAEKLEHTIGMLEETTLLRLQSATHGSLRKSLDEVSRLANAARSAAKPEENERLRYRPLGTFKHRAINLLITGLYRMIVVEAKGELTLWHESNTGDLSGTLPRVLALVRPYLPDIFPKHMSYSMLQRSLARAKKAYS